MAVRTPNKTTPDQGNVVVFQWSGLLIGDSGEARGRPEWADKSVQVSGTFGGATLIIEGTNDGVTYHTLNDPFSNATSFTSAGLKAVVESPMGIRPRVTGGDGTTSITVTLAARRVQ